MQSALASAPTSDTVPLPLFRSTSHERFSCSDANHSAQVGQVRAHRVLGDVESVAGADLLDDVGRGALLELLEHRLGLEARAVEQPGKCQMHEVTTAHHLAGFSAAAAAAAGAASEP